ncbi:hypothetical protein D7X55_14260 [Corallococcus sp. AB049A]|uniref:Uncharacterized protein n=1 Tax=Corallococcus interemptor TaxID=2316720 RepID=A0A3A8QRF5_9BACT|nr:MULTISPECIES: hypothetical protein [Corallococcus]RKH54046.1 hypothetical protein D7Y23_01740 [Corallococcus sp. AB050B]RKH65734.1 hypothetical protein D7X96_23225 [Corallococcus interemptor]RKI66984.1 hypothetical protein D7X55_14260 [Corallococcus sp. AB049A]
MHTNHFARKLFLAAPLCLFAVGCGGDPMMDGSMTGEGATEAAAPSAPEDAALGTSEQGIGLGGTYWWGTSANGLTSTTIGTATNRTCFLRGIRGNLKGTSWAGAGVFQYAGNWEIFINQSNSKALRTDVQCINTATNRTPEVSWYDGQAAKLLGAVTSARRCFLTQVEAAGGFTANADYARVWNDGYNWYLGGNLGAAGGARALCVDVPSDAGGWLWIAGNPGTFTHNLAYNPGGVACMLSGIGGNFSTSDYDDGVTIDYNAGTRYWEMTVSNSKRGWGNCVK